MVNICIINFFDIGLSEFKYFNPFNILWFKFGIALGKFISPIIVGLVFSCVTPTGLIMRLLKDLQIKKK